MSNSQWRDLTTEMPQSRRDTEKRKRNSSVSLRLCGQFSSVEIAFLTSDSHKTLPALTPSTKQG
jgi:hypothetical protein